jgi:octaprenyl-diphosphate synthase
MVKLVDTPASGVGGFTAVEVQVLFWAPYFILLDMTMHPFHDVVQDDFDSVNQLIIKQLHSSVDLVENIGHYIVEAGGKRLRPLLVLLSARSLGYTGKAHINLAAIIEFIHTATLLHDDVVDLSQLRRNRPTANAKWGNAPSVLVGDFLYSRAFQMMVSIGNMRVMDIMSEATNVIAEGEVLQLVNAGDPDTTEERYLKVIHFKTAKLFEAAAQLGAVIAGNQADNTETFRQYGYHLGMAFQLVDDMLDYSGSSAELGKNIGDDLAEGKPTLPLIYTLQNGSSEDQLLIRHAITHKDGSCLTQVIEAVQRSHALRHTRLKAEQERDKAIVAITELAESKYKQALVSLAEFSVSRSF